MIASTPLPAARVLCLTIIKAHMASEPASIAYLIQRTGLSDRTIKAVVEDARMAGDPICARRTKPNGYYWASTAEELEASAATLRNQAFRMLMGAGRLIGKHRIREMLGQLTVEIIEKSC